MPERRRQRRPITAPGSAAPVPSAVQMLPTPVVDQAGVALENFLVQLRNVARMKRYALLGRLSRMNVSRPDALKTIDFRKDGPVLGIVPESNQLIVTTPWRGLPARWDDTEEFCPDCLADCDVCGGRGSKLCEAYQCGGSGKIPTPMEGCEAPGCAAESGQANPNCATCKGRGYTIGSKDCTMCNGTGQMVCSSCRGTKRRPTGNKGGSLNWRDPACETCGGSKFHHKEIPQRIDDFTNARIGSMIALGPIVRFAIESVGGSGVPPQVYDVEPDQNDQGLVLLLESDQPGAGAFLIGGVFNPVTRRV